MPTRLTRALPAALLLASASALAAQNDSTWRDHGRAAEAARAAGSWADYRHHLLEAERIVGSHPSLPIGLARAAAGLGDTAAAFTQLRRFAAMGLVRDLAADPGLASLRGTPAWDEIERAVRANAEPVGRPEVVFTLADRELVPDDLAYDGARRRWLLTSVRRGKVVAVDERGVATDFVPAGRDGAWAMQGLALDSARERLWVTTTALRQGPRYTPADSGRAAILRYHLPTGRLERRYDLPRGAPHAPGDLALAENGDLFIGDGRTGVLYVIRARRDSLDTLVHPGLLGSAQQAAALPGGLRVAVADYSRGIAEVDRLTAGLRWLTPAPEVVLTGIDGLLEHGGTLIAVQNGVTPHRVVRLHLDAEGHAVTRAEVLLRDTASVREPTHAVVRDGYLYLIANSGWDALADDGTLRRGVRLLPARVVRIPLP